MEMEAALNNLNSTSQNCCNLEEKLTEIWKIISLQSREIKLLKDLQKIELQNRDKIINNLRTRINVLEKDVNISKIKMEHYEMNLDDNEQYSRRHSIRLAGIEKKKQKETPGEVMQKIYEEMDYLDAHIDELEIDRAHRTGSKYQDENGKWQQPILLKFISWKARNEMYSLRKFSHFHISADLTYKNEQLLNYAKDQIRLEGSITNKNIKFAYADANCSLMAFTYTGRFFKFNSETEFNDIAVHVDNISRISENIYDTIGKELSSPFPGE